MSTSPGPSERRTPLVILVSMSIVSFLAGLGLLEAGLATMVAHPPSQTWRAVARAYYYYWERRVVQYLPECSRYDADLFYTLKPGRCRFENREFSVDIRVDTLGLRAATGTSEVPAVLVLGDSYAMGWGVAQDSTFASHIEQLTGLATLNTAQSSYGTARELLGLRRVDLARARYLIIQYCGNDFAENVTYLDGGGSLPIRSRAEYDSIVAEHLRTVRYYPGKYIRRILPLLRDQWLAGTQAATSTPRDFQREAEVFVRSLLLSPVELDDLTIIVIEMEPHRLEGPQFADQLRQEVRRMDYPRWVNDIKVLDVSPLLSSSDYFVYDDHVRPSGHAKIADLIVREIEATEVAGRSAGLERQ